MKIDNSVKGTGSTVSGSASSNSRGRADKAPAPSAGAEASTQVQISSLASLGVDSVLANAPVTNPHKIAEIKQAIAEGRFSINPEKIASGLIDSVRELLGKPGSNA
jgi:negative regulator of flagellin synthesis FlgM